MTARNIGVRKVKVSDVELNENNFRRHSDQQRKALDAVVSEIGWYGYPIVYKTGDGKYKLIDGELRRDHIVAKYGEDAIIEVLVTDFDDKEAAIAIATHDPISAMASQEAAAFESLTASIGTEISDDMLSLIQSIGETILIEDFVVPSESDSDDSKEEGGRESAKDPDKAIVFSCPLTKWQDENITEAIKVAKDLGQCETTGAALEFICNYFMKEFGEDDGNGEGPNADG